MSRALALIDGNSFHCSCERVFDPKLRRVPVIVLSNADGCAIARTSEAKALGIGMGEPFFKIRDPCRREGVPVELRPHGSMSARANEVYRRFSPRVEIYSIDESFLDLSDVAPPLRVELGSDLGDTVLRWTGLPTCVGIGPTKTLAKLANHLAKKCPELGVCDLSDERGRAAWLACTPRDAVWGVGPASVAELKAMGCATVADVRDLDPRPARRDLAVVGERIIHELRGLACLELETVAATRKGCAVTRMFSGRIEDRATMEQAVAAHAARLGEKLRREGLAPTTSPSSITRARRPAPLRLHHGVAARGELGHAAPGAGRHLGGAAHLARRVPLKQGRPRHHGPRAPPRLAARAAGRRPAEPGALGRVDGGARRVQQALRPRHGGGGLGRRAEGADLGDEVRDALAALPTVGAAWCVWRRTSRPILELESAPAP